MTQAQTRLTFEEYLSLDAEGWLDRDLPEGRCEYIDGEVVELPFEDRINAKIALFLLARLLEVFPEDQLCCKDTEIEVSGSKAKTRVPDLMLLSAELAAILGDGRSRITMTMPPPELIVEVVSPGDRNGKRDYQDKSAEYAARSVLEYWAINPEDRKVTVFTLQGKSYQRTDYTEEMVIPSQFEGLRLTPVQIFNRRR
jgi:Uma2 family endonuclease